jgi:hypothetical protein
VAAGCEAPFTSGAQWASVLRYQCSVRSTYEARAGIVHPARASIGEHEVQPVGVPVPAAASP